MTGAQLAAALDRSSLVQAQAVASAIRGGWRVEGGSDRASIEELARTYALRLGHLQGIRSAHAQQLAASVEEFLAELRAHAAESVGTWFTVGSEAEHQFLVFVSASGEPLGCMRTVSQLRVPPHSWREFWDGEA